MGERKRLILLILIMTAVSMTGIGTSIVILHNTAFNDTKERLVETAQSQARLIEAIARYHRSYDKGDYPGGAEAVTLSQITDANRNYMGFGKTGEFTLARREGDQIVFLLRHRHADLDKPKPVPFDSELAEPMRRALSGRSGTVVGLDYRGVPVLAAYAPVSELDWGIVAKLDLSEVYAPYVRAGIIASCIGASAILLGAFLFLRLINPVIRRMKESEQRYRSLVENIDLGITRLSADYKIMMTNAVSSRMLRKPVCEIVGKYCFEEFEKRKAVCAHCPGAKAMATGNPAEAETVGVLDDGSRVPVCIHAFPVMNPDGSPDGFIEVVEDITVRKQAEAGLKERERFLSDILSSIQDGISILDKDFTILRVNPTLEDWYSHSLPLAGKKCYEVYHQRKEPCKICPSRKTIQTGKAAHEVVPKTGPDAQTVGWLDLYSFPFLDTSSGELRGVIEYVRDITERKRLEEEISKTQHLRALGNLAGGIAHDFNNYLTTIMSNISIARIYGNVEEDISRILTDAESASIRARDLTQQLLTFATGGVPNKKIFNVSKVLKETTRFTLSGSNVSAEYSMPDDLWLVEADEGQISQVIQNMVINADQAMPGGGTIKITAKNMTLEEKGRLRLKQGKYVRISIEDQGCGMAESQLSKIFDPFFTTKEKGRGLGLATSYSIVNRHQGHIHVDSKVGIGTTFEVYLPAFEEKARKEEIAREKVFKGKGKILLVDDDELIRKSGSEIMMRLGCEVTLAKEGWEGIRIYKQAMETISPFDAVILDLTIPGGMGGKDTVKELKKVDPKAKVILCSGYSDDPVISKHREHGFAGAVLKPYGIEALVEVLHKVLSMGA